MFFLGYTSILAGVHSGDPTPTSVNTITSQKLENGIFDDDFMTATTTSSTIPLNEDWDYSTYIHAQFQGNLSAGNTDMVLSTTDHILTKIRKHGDYNWINVFSNKVSDELSLTFENFYRYAKANTTYDVALVPVMASGIEGNYNVNTVDSSFDGLYIMEKDSGYYTRMAVLIPDRQKNRPSSVINTLFGQYPYVIYPSQNKYDSFSVKGFFCLLNSITGLPDGANGYDYRDKFMNWLLDSQPKYIKIYDGRGWVINVVDTPKESQSAPIDYIETTFNAVEVGDSSNQSDLYNNNLIDVVS